MATVGVKGLTTSLQLMLYCSSHTSVSALPMSMTQSPVRDRRPVAAAYQSDSNLQPLQPPPALSPYVEQVFVTAHRSCLFNTV